MLNTYLLKSKRVLNNMTQEDMAKVIETETPTYNKKENAHVEFKPSEIQKIIESLKLTSQESIEIFFSKELPKV